MMVIDAVQSQELSTAAWFVLMNEGTSTLFNLRCIHGVVVVYTLFKSTCSVTNYRTSQHETDDQRSPPQTPSNLRLTPAIP